MLALVLGPSQKNWSRMSSSSTVHDSVHGGQHDTKYVTFELLMHAAFVSDKIWGFTLEPGRGRQRRHASVAWAPPPTSCVGGGSPKMPPEKQRRWCRYRSLERILCVLGLSLGSRAFWAIVRFEKLRLRPPRYSFRRYRRGTLCYGL